MKTDCWMSSPFYSYVSKIDYYDENTKILAVS